MEALYCTLNAGINSEHVLTLTEFPGSHEKAYFSASEPSPDLS